MAVSRQTTRTTRVCQLLWMCLAVFGGFIVSVSGNATESDFMNLRHKLLGNYNRFMRPLTNQSETMTVSLQFDLLSVSDIDDVKQRISVLAVISVQWSDKNLVWNPDDYGGIDRMYFDEDNIWAPTVYIEESQTKGPTLFNLPTNHLVLPDGIVTFVSSGILETSCSLDMTYFPYDYQSCRFGFGILDSSRRDVALESSSIGPKKSSSYVEDGEWSVYGFGTAINYYGRDHYESQTLYVILKMQRRALYYILNVIVPSVTVSLMSLLTFAVPVECGERLTYALTNLLSLAVYITYIGSIMPSSSVDLPIILRYLVVLFIISSMCVVMTVVVIAVRWSRVVVVSEHYKSIFIFGFPIKFKRRRNTLLTHKKKVERQITESTSISSSEIQSLCDSPDEKKFVNDSTQGKDAIQRKVAIPVSFGQSNVRRTPLPLEMKDVAKNAEDLPKGFKEPFREYDVTNSEMDPDIIYICTKIDLGSFCVLLLTFLLMTTISAAQYNGQDVV